MCMGVIWAPRQTELCRPLHCLKCRECGADGRSPVPNPSPPHPDLDRSVHSRHSCADIIHTLCRSFRDNLKVRGYFRSRWASRKVSLRVVDLWVRAPALFKKLMCARRLRRASQRLLQCPDAGTWSLVHQVPACVATASHWLLRDMHECIYRSRRVVIAGRWGGLTHNSIIILRRHPVRGKLNVS